MSTLPVSLMGASPLGRPIIDESFLDDPYPTYQRLREAGPIHWSDEFFGGAWLLTRHADVEMMLRDPRFSARRTGGWVMNSGDGARDELKGFQQLFGRAMLFLDAPDSGARCGRDRADASAPRRDSLSTPSISSDAA